MYEQIEYNTGYRRSVIIIEHRTRTKMTKDMDSNDWMINHVPLKLATFMPLEIKKNKTRFGN